MNLVGDRVEVGLSLSQAGVSGVRDGKYGESELALREMRALPQDLMGRVSELSNLSKACARVISNGGSAGVDGMGVGELKEWFNRNHSALQESLRNGSYQPQPVLGVAIPKAQGGTRELGIPTVIDRLVQQALHQILSPYYEEEFSASSHGYRPGRSAHGAILQAGRYVAGGKTYIVDLDLSKFFDRVQHDRLLWRLSQRIEDRRVLQLIGRYLRSGMLREGLLSQRTEGTPQGGPLSPLLSNIVLTELDTELSRRGHCFVRYADDVIILCGSRKSAHRVKESIIRFIEERLKLLVNQRKSRICRPWELNFLGHRLLLNGEAGLSGESERRFKNKVRELTRRNRGKSFSAIIGELNPKLQGWINYFHLAKMRKKVDQLEGWIKRKLRCYRLKQCKRSYTLMKFLKSLGVPEWRAWILAQSGKGWWRKSLSYQAAEGMNNEWFARQGLLSLSALYKRSRT
jgi:group II intron reverse transcriptase/maturase